MPSSFGLIKCPIFPKFLNRLWAQERKHMTTNKGKIQNLAKQIKKEIQCLHIIEAKTIARKMIKGKGLRNVLEWFEERGGKIKNIEDSYIYCNLCSCNRYDSILKFRGFDIYVENDCCGPIIIPLRDACENIGATF